MKYRVLPYRQGSKSAKALAEALGGKVLKLEGSKFKPRPDDVIINWGSTDPTVFPRGEGGYDCFNPPEDIKAASNKLIFFQTLKDKDLTPKYYTKKEDIPNDDYPIVCRTVLSGHSGAGIVIADDVGGLVDAPLYVKYEKKKEEYRVHLGRVFIEGGAELPVFETAVIAVQRKARRNDYENPDWKVRAHSNGFNFVRTDVVVPACVGDAAVKAFKALNLDFGAVDVIYNEHKEKAYVLEINTAPGLEGQTISDYANYFKSVGLGGW